MTWIDNLVNRMAEEEILKAKRENLQQSTPEKQRTTEEVDSDGND